jgi:TolB protein
MDADGGTVTQITDAPGDDLSPAWSPDGTLIAFSGGGEGNSEIYVVPTTGGEPVNLTNDPGDDFSPAWSPDGTLIAFSSYRGEGLDAEVFLMNADGSDQRAITSNDAMDGAPAWSPDGTRIAFESDRDAPPPESPSPGMIVFTAGISDIYVMNADGSDVVRVTQRADGGGAAHPSWSPDGTYLAYGLGQFGMHGIAIVRPDGADEQILIGPDDAGASSPDWGPA